MIPRGTYHMYAIGSQECMRSIAKSVLRPSKDAWEVRDPKACSGWSPLPFFPFCFLLVILHLNVAAAEATVRVPGQLVREDYRVRAERCVCHVPVWGCATMHVCAGTRWEPFTWSCSPTDRWCPSLVVRFRLFCSCGRLTHCGPDFGTDVQSEAVACGIKNTLGNKGGVGVSLCVGQTSLLFVCCHLAGYISAVCCPQPLSMYTGVVVLLYCD